jgi:hypothetical protein
VRRVQSAFGQAVIIDNVAGASGSIGLGRLGRATTDGSARLNVRWTRIRDVRNRKLSFRSQPMSLYLRWPQIFAAAKYDRGCDEAVYSKPAEIRQREPKW